MVMNPFVLEKTREVEESMMKIGPMPTQDHQILDDDVSMTDSMADEIISIMDERNFLIEDILIDDSQHGIGGMKAATENKCQHEGEDERHHPFLRCCIHEGSWANIYCFDDSMKSFGGRTGALV
eukprot:12882756-Ditylum_brightwellii.AAC.1